MSYNDRAIDGGLKKWWQYPAPSSLPMSDSASNEYHSGDPGPLGHCVSCAEAIWDEDIYTIFEDTDDLLCADCIESCDETSGLL